MVRNLSISPRGVFNLPVLFLGTFWRAARWGHSISHARAIAKPTNDRSFPAAERWRGFLATMVIGNRFNICEPLHELVTTCPATGRHSSCFKVAIAKFFQLNSMPLIEAQAGSTSEIQLDVMSILAHSLSFENLPCAQPLQQSGSNRQPISAIVNALHC